MLRKSPLGWLLLSGASLAAIAGSAHAQDGGAVSDEIVVTATGREAAIQDVPIAVTALSGEAIENANIDDVRDLEQLAPSLRVASGQSNSAGTIARIRGIGTGGDNPGFEAAVGIFIDGVYRARAGVALADLPEVSRVEVLRGPQGTLFGRNTTAGAISIVTAGPDYETGAWLSADFGLDDLEETAARGGINIPIVDDVFALRFDGSVRARDGYITDIISGDDFNDRNRWSARLQGLWDISPDASLRVIFDAAETDEDCCGAVTFLNGSSTPLINGITNLLYPGFGANRGILCITPAAGICGPQNVVLEDRLTSRSPNRDYGEQVSEWGLSGELNWDLGGVNLTSITAYRDWDTDRNQDIDFSLIDRAYRDGLTIGFENWTQEFRLQGEFGRVNWIVGGFYGSETIDQTDTIRVGNDGAVFLEILSRNLDSSGDGVADADRLFHMPAVLGGLIGAGDFFIENALTTLGIGLPADRTAFAALVAPLAPLPGQGQNNDVWNQETESWSLFTHNEINLTDSLVATIGVRFNHEEKDVSAALNSNIAACSAFQTATNSVMAFQVLQYAQNGANPLALRGVANNILTALTIGCNPVVNTAANGNHFTSSEENEWNGTASLAWHVNDDLMVYGGYSRGYKAGGFNLDRSGFSALLPFSSAALPPTLPNVSQLHFNPEFVDNFEVGVRSTLFGGSTFLNVTAFYQTISDYQLNAFSGFNFLTINAPELISRGVEVDVLTRPTDNLTFQGGVVWNDAYYSQNAVFPTETIVDGTPLAGAPEWSVTGAITYELPITDNFGVRFYVDGRWNSEYRLQTLARNPATDQESFALFNGRVTLGDPDGRWAVDVWGRNLTDEYYNVGAFTVPEQTNLAAFPNEPRTWGVTLRARY